MSSFIVQVVFVGSRGAGPRCYTHKQQCVRAEGGAAAAAECSGHARLRIFAAGSPCVDFSMMGELLKFGGRTALVFLVLMKLILTASPDVFIFENVTGFPEKTVVSLTQGLYNSDSALLCPSFFGFAVKRVRRYIVFRKLASIVKAHPLQALLQSSRTLFTSSMLIDDSMVAVVPDGTDKLTGSRLRRS